MAEAWAEIDAQSRPKSRAKRSVALQNDQIVGFAGYSQAVFLISYNYGETAQMTHEQTGCMTCELIAARDAGTAPLWDCIHRTQFWDVVHSYNTALPGWMVLVARRHIEAIDELTDEEAVELGTLLRKLSIALKEITGCVKTYVIQFAEAAEHPHVHFHVVPRMADQPEERRSTKIFGYLDVPVEERVSEQQMTEIAVQIRRALT